MDKPTSPSKTNQKRIQNIRNTRRNKTNSNFFTMNLEKNGEFLKDFDPMKGWLGFQEGNGAQYTWYAPHDIAGLINL